MKQIARPSVFHFANYREFIREYYKYLVSIDKTLTTRKFAKIAGLKSHSHLNLIINGSRNISGEFSDRIADAFELTKKETTYFQLLVSFNQEESAERKDIYWQKIVRFLGLPASAGFTEDHFRVFVSWKIPTVFEAMRTSFFSGTKSSLHKMLSHIISEEEIDQSVNTLVQLGVISIENGKITLSETRDIASPHSVPFELFSKYHQSLFELATDAMRSYDENQRFFTGITLALSDAGYEKLKKIAAELEGEVADLQKKDQPASGVYQINIQVFPIFAKSDKN